MQPKAPMLVGVNAAPAELDDTIARFSAMKFSRVFAAPGKGIPTWRSPTMTKLIAARIIPWVSFKDWASDSTATIAVNAWLDALPPTLKTRAALTYHHEPMGDAGMNPDLFRARWIKLRQLRDAHPNGAKVAVVPIFHLYPARHKCSDVFSHVSSSWVGDWVRWWPVLPSGRPAGDFMGWDCYQDIDATSYENPRSFFRIPVGAAYTAGVPLIVPELGAVRVPSDLTGNGRAQWITDCAAHLAANDAAGVAWWHGDGTNGMNYRLLDAPSRTAWQAAIG